MLSQYIYSVYCILLFTILLIIVFPLVLLSLLFPEKIKHKSIYNILKTWSYVWHFGCFMYPVVYNKEKIDFSKNYIITPNHQSFVDASLLYITLNQLFKPLGKVEIGKIPLFGLIYKSVVVTVDRSSMTARVKSIRKLNEEINQGLSVVIFPEGTFKDIPQDTLLPFQEGAFSLAIQNQTQILPLLFLDASKRVHPSSLFKLSPGAQRMVILPPVATHAFTKEDTKMLTEKMHFVMQHVKNFAISHKPSDIWDYCINFMKENNIG